MHRAFARVAVPFVAVALFALTVAPSFAAGDAERVTGGGWLYNTYVYVPPTEDDPGVPPGGGEDPQPPPEESSIFNSVFSAADSNPKCTFGFVASGTPNADRTAWTDPEGELSFHDHGKGLKLKSLNMTLVDFDPDGKTAVFEGDAEARCADGPYPVKFRVTVVDNGEPGSYDTFTVDLLGWVLPTDGYPYVATGTLGGGNIQLHQ